MVNVSHTSGVTFDYYTQLAAQTTAFAVKNAACASIVYSGNAPLVLPLASASGGSSRLDCLASPSAAGDQAPGADLPTCLGASEPASITLAVNGSVHWNCTGQSYCLAVHGVH